MTTSADSVTKGLIKDALDAGNHYDIGELHQRATYHGQLAADRAWDGDRYDCMGQDGLEFAESRVAALDEISELFDSFDRSQLRAVLAAIHDHARGRLAETVHRSLHNYQPNMYTPCGDPDCWLAALEPEVLADYIRYGKVVRALEDTKAANRTAARAGEPFSSTVSVDNVGNDLPDIVRAATGRPALAVVRDVDDSSPEPTESLTDASVDAS